MSPFICWLVCGIFVSDSLAECWHPKGDEPFGSMGWTPPRWMVWCMPYQIFGCSRPCRSFRYECVVALAWLTKFHPSFLDHRFWLKPWTRRAYFSSLFNQVVLGSLRILQVSDFASSESVAQSRRMRSSLSNSDREPSEAHLRHVLPRQLSAGLPPDKKVITQFLIDGWSASFAFLWFPSRVRVGLRRAVQRRLVWGVLPRCCSLPKPLGIKNPQVGPHAYEREWVLPVFWINLGRSSRWWTLYPDMGWGVLVGTELEGESTDGLNTRGSVV